MNDRGKPAPRSGPLDAGEPFLELDSITDPRFRQAAQRVLGALAAAPTVLAAGLFGSVPEGRTWEGSDLDLLVVVFGDDPGLQRGLELREGDVRVHLQYLSRAAFERAVRESRGGNFSRVAATVQWAFCRDEEIERVRAEQASFPEANRRIRALAALSQVKYALDRAEKLIYLGEPLGAFTILAGAFQELAKLKLYLRGRYPGRVAIGDALTSEPGLIAQFNDFCDGVLPLGERLDRAVEYLHETAEELVPQAARDLFEFLREAPAPISVEEIEEHERYKGLPVVFPELLEWLCDLGFLDRGTRPFVPAFTPGQPGNILKECVYTPANRRS
ncbi:MAG: hypothetical protein M1598_00940 [Actinobacteria bacterium]|nr:hypothetical protein [Actinomycetota bacterium]